MITVAHSSVPGTSTMARGMDPVPQYTKVPGGTGAVATAASTGSTGVHVSQGCGGTAGMGMSTVRAGDFVTGIRSKTSQMSLSRTSKIDGGGATAAEQRPAAADASAAYGYVTTDGAFL